ncbi:hypothetical protein NPIL_682221, partial [Nephila pilipes]
MGSLDLSAQQEFESARGLSFSCTCDKKKHTCKCCGTVDYKKGKIKETCIELKYDGSKTAITVSVFVNNKVLVSKTLS